MRGIALTGSIALLGTALGSCDSADRLAAPSEEIGPQFSAGAANSHATGRFQFLAPSADADLDGTVVYDVEVGAAGKLLVLTGSSNSVVLYVQPGTVRQNTEFVISVSTDAGMVYVELSATSYGSTVLNDVGAKGFKKPVILAIELSALDVAGLDPARFAIAEYTADGRILPTRSAVTENGWLLGYLNHFSGWVPIAN